MAGRGDLNAVFCPAHPNAYLVDDYAAGDMICSECGLVVGDRVIDVSAEWRSFSNDAGDKKSDRSRVGAAMNVSLSKSSSLFTIIEKMPQTGQRYSKGGHQYDNQKQPNDDRLARAVKTLKIQAERINLPSSVVHRGTNLLCQIIKKKKARVTESCVSACLYLACREENVPRSFKEIAALSSSSVKDIGHKYKSIIKLLGSHTDTVDASEYMTRYCTCLSLPKPIQKTAKHIARAAASLGILINRSPLTIAAVSIYLASVAFDEVLPFKDISSVVGVCEATIRQVYKVCLPVAVDLFPVDFQFVKPLCEFPDFYKIQ